MNWTAILALLAGGILNLIQLLVTRDATERADEAWRHIDDHAASSRQVLQGALAMAAENERLKTELADAERRARRRELSHTVKPQSEVQHQERGNAAD